MWWLNLIKDRSYNDLISFFGEKFMDWMANVHTHLLDSDMHGNMWTKRCISKWSIIVSYMVSQCRTILLTRFPFIIQVWKIGNFALFILHNIYISYIRPNFFQISNNSLIVVSKIYCKCWKRLNIGPAMRGCGASGTAKFVLTFYKKSFCINWPSLKCRRFN